MPTEGWSFTPQRTSSLHAARILLMLGIGAALLAALLALNLPPAIAQGPGPITAGCYAVADETSTGTQPDTLVSLDPDTGTYDNIGLTGTDGIEAIAFGPTRNLYAVNLNNLITLDLFTGAATVVGPIGSGTGSASPNPILLDNVDGMTFSLSEGVFYATHRREGTPTDLLFTIDPATGALIQDHFGAGVDYVEVPAVPDPTNPGLSLTDVDDLAFDPLHDQLLAAMNSGGTGGVLVRLDPMTGMPTFLYEFRYPNPYPANPALAGTVIDDIEGLAYGNDGQLYGSTGTNGPPGAPGASDLNQLFAIDDTNGLGVSVGSLQPTPADPQDFEALDCLSARVFIELRKYTNGPGQAPDDADLPTGPNIVQGDPVVWTYVFTNTGFITLTNLVLSDDILGTIGPAGVSNCPPAGTILPPGDSVTCTAGGTAQLGQYANTAIVTGTSVVLPGVPAETVTDTNPSHYFGVPFQGPSIALKKYTNGPGQAPQDADAPTGPFIVAGNVVTWTYRFTNTGTVPLTDVVLVDNVIGPIGPGGASNCPPPGTNLAPGESLTCTATGTAQLGQYANTGVVSGTNTVEPFQVVTANDPSHYFGTSVTPTPGIAIRKYTNGFDANGPNGSDAPAIDPPGPTSTGDITWTYQVTNTGNVSFPVAAVVVTDNRVTGTLPSLVDNGDGDGFLAPGEVWLYELLGTAAALPAVPNPDPGPPPGYERGCQQYGSVRSVYVNVGTVAVTGTSLTANDPSRYCNVTPTADSGGEEPSNPRANAVFLPMIGQ